MRYLKIEWIHNLEHEPIIIYSEIDDKYNEIRKVEIYRDNKIEYADLNTEFGGTRLSEEPLLTLSETASDNQFKPMEIGKREFEKVWLKRIQCNK
ncbi:hypothetical protein N4T77_19780 [Clostridium sp. CX1]|uniref:DUF6881 domain-containing protein n=1 Tax=Clostridium tanneri TaxID=3037988 RepID=A0ABU4JYB0_9CLOT|nr:MULTISPECIES: hypothetical protein [unclassified Clostridium]MCT8978822.1 hypothetical protein [Clostridium sp. CX1]MDW8803147.1 hypothetical protein [Clostridium sp. A1-XYC3]